MKIKADLTTRENNRKNEEKKNKQTKEKHRIEQFIKDPKKSLVVLAVPIVIGMMVQVLYQMADTAFVGRLGTDALAALTLSFPVFFILISLSQGIASGINARISRYLGEKNKAAAESTAVHGIIISLISALLIFIIGQFALEPLLALLGADGDVLRLSMDFMSIILAASFFTFPSAALSSIFASQGDTKTSMKVQATSLILNIILDPILIYYLGLGVKGAAIATAIAYFFSMSFFLYYIEHSYLKMTWKDFVYFKFDKNIVKQIFSVGIPASMMMMIIAIYSMFNNYFMSHFGINYIASAGMVARIESLVTMPMVALSMALLTLTSMFHGAKRHDLLEDTAWHAIKIGVLFAVSVAVLVLFFPKIFLRIFTDDTVLLEVGTNYLRIYALGFPLIAIAMITSRVMQGIGKGFSSFFIHLFRLFVIAVPLSYIFVYVLNLNYLFVAVAMLIGNTTSNILSVIWMRRHINKSQ